METLSLVQIGLQVLGIAALIYASWRLLRRLQRRQQGLQLDRRLRAKCRQPDCQLCYPLPTVTTTTGKSSPPSSLDTETHKGQPNTSNVSSSASSPVKADGK